MEPSGGGMTDLGPGDLEGLALSSGSSAGCLVDAPGPLSPGTPACIHRSRAGRLLHLQMICTRELGTVAAMIPDRICPVPADHRDTPARSTHASSPLGGSPMDVITRTVDAKGQSCPGPLVTLAKALKDASRGDLLELLATDPGFAFRRAQLGDDQRQRIAGVRRARRRHVPLRDPEGAEAA